MPILGENCSSKNDCAGNVLNKGIPAEFARNRIVQSVVMTITIVFA
jgi:hypothetical protein